MHYRARLPLLIATLAFVAGLLGSFQAMPVAADVVDLDGDSVIDGSDLCPAQPGAEENDGCPAAELVFSGLVGTKLNASSPIKIQTTVEIEMNAWLESAQTGTGAATQGAIRFNTADTATWKAPVKTAANTWSFTTKAGNNASAGVYLNGQWRAMQVGTQLTIKFVGDGKSLYLKFAGMAPTGFGINRVGIEAESVGGRLEGPLALISHTPAQDAVVGGSAVISATFNGPLSGFNLNSATIDCGNGTAAFTSATISGKTVTLMPVAPLPGGATCTVYIAASAPSDLDAVDPPDGLIADYYFSFLTDQAPGVLFTTPANGETVAGPSVVVAAAFSEPVTLDAGAVIISGCHNHSSAAQPTAGLYFNYQVNSATAGTCTITVVASKVHDVDTFDAPDIMASDVTSTFTIEAPPEVTIVSPVNGSVTGTQPILRLESNEYVSYASGAIEISGCTSWTSVAISPFNVVNFTLPPLPQGTTCTLTVHRLLVSDVDGVGEVHPLEDESVTFTVDAAPYVVSTTPSDSDDSDSSDTMDPTGEIRVKYSEPMQMWTILGVTLVCNGVDLDVTQKSTALDNTVVIFKPYDDTAAALHGGANCTLTVPSGAFRDADTVDAPNHPPAHPRFPRERGRTIHQTDLRDPECLESCGTVLGARGGVL